MYSAYSTYTIVHTQYRPCPRVLQAFMQTSAKLGKNSGNIQQTVEAAVRACLLSKQ